MADQVILGEAMWTRKLGEVARLAQDRNAVCSLCPPQGAQDANTF